MRTRIFQFLLVQLFLMGIWEAPMFSQCMDNHGNRLDRYCNIVLLMDQSYINHFSTVDQARMQAEQKADDAIAALNNSYSFSGYFKLHFKKIFFPLNTVAPPKSTPDPSTWCINIQDYFHVTKFPCVPSDCILLFTDAVGTGFDFGYDGVAIINYGAEAPFKIAHEIGHVLGLVHVFCTDPNPNSALNFMYYDGGGPDIAIPAYCQTTSTIDGLIFKPNQCTGLSDEQSVFPNDYVCPPVNNSMVNLFLDTDNPNPILTCKANGNILNYTATIVNDATNTSRNIRAKISAMDAPNAVFIPGPGLSIKPFSDRTELWFVDNQGNEKYFPLGPNETVTVHFQVQYLGPDQYGDRNFDVYVYTGTNYIYPNKQTHYPILPFYEVTSPSFLANSSWPGASPIYIRPGLNLNMDNTQFSFDFGSNKQILFGTGASMTIGNGSVVGMNHVAISGCDNMWKGITVLQGGTLHMTNITSVRDAQYAVTVDKGAVFSATDCIFYDNNFGVRNEEVGTGNYNITLLSNTFGGTLTNLKPPYTGQAPLPVGKSYAGVYFNNVTSGISISTNPGSRKTNYFDNLKYGILSYNTPLAVFNTAFSNIKEVPQGSGYPGPLLNGYAIYSSGGALNVQGGGVVSGYPPVTFTNCTIGVVGNYSDLVVSECNMDKMQTGVSNLGGLSNISNLKWNTINASLYGIFQFQYGNSMPSDIENNTISIDGDPSNYGIGIMVTGGTGSNQGEQVTVASNPITVNVGATGVYLGYAINTHATGNTVNLLNSHVNDKGIWVEGGDNNVINCNNITGSISSSGSPSEGVYALLPSRTGFVCNSVTGTDFGFHFDGALTGKTKVDFKGNSMANNTIGLLLGPDAVIGAQKNNGNTFTGTATIAENLNTAGANLSLFTVDSQENPNFLPNQVIPASFFLDVPDPAISYYCVAGVSCPLPETSGKSSLDKTIAKGELVGTSHQAADNWLAQRRLYEKIWEEGNPEPRDQDISNFLKNARAQGLAGYAEMQSDIRNGFLLNSSDRIDLSNSRTLTFSKLAELGDIDQQIMQTKDAELLKSLQLRRIEILASIRSSEAAAASIRAALQSTTATTALNLIPQNGSLAGSDPYMVNEKIVNEILLGQIADNYRSFTASEIATLTAIANQCPLSGGEAVLRARALLRIAKPGPFHYDDAALCGAAPVQTRSDNAIQTEGKVTIFPNPASTEFTIRYSLPDDQSNYRLMVFNTYGQMVKDLSLTGWEGSQSVPVETLLSGVYQYVIKSDNSIFAQGKFVIVK
jgi:hypothetical protein